MTLSELQQHLLVAPAARLEIALPDGGRVAPHFHVTEVGHVTKRFIDCGGTIRRSEACVLQTHVGSARDDGHRLEAGKLAKILDLARPILPAGDLPVEVEHDDGVISQFPLVSVQAAGATLILHVGSKHTACLAQDRCGMDARESAEPEPAGCCSGGGCC